MQYSRRRIGAFARVLGNWAAEYFDPVMAGYDGYRDVIAPAAFAVVPVQAAQTALAAELLPDGLALLHGINLEIAAPIVANQALVVGTRVEQRRESGGMLAVTTRNTITNHDGAQLAVVTQKLALLPKGARRDSASAGAKGALAQNDGGCDASSSSCAERSGDAGSLGPFTLQITPKDLADYVTVSDDANPVHTSAGYAAEFGYGAPLAQGMLLVGRALAHLESQSGRYLIPGRIQARFIAPVEVPPDGADIIVQQTTKNEQTELTFYVHGQRVIRAVIG